MGVTVRSRHLRGGRPHRRSMTASRCPACGWAP